jgi:hypothetical protein
MATLLELLPRVGIPTMSFPHDRNTYYYFLMQPRLFMPALVRLRWHLDDHRHSFGEVKWKTRLLSLPDEGAYDSGIPSDCHCRHGDMAAMIRSCSHPGRDRRSYRDVDFTDCTDRTILFVYRDTSDPADTGIGCAHLTSVVIRWG